ncbi:phospholipase D active site motif domain-containing protein [Hirsutella rhossiliensis]|uniref:Phospholipase n=1 Tax=Hirsutella rhossiliensis TaxID=111463 RepID=A0A9P8SNZ6_9HYPO|nr:phospholipase D active site motif domain-containing protein [Hirsutella rhossiliensis]KAH0967656.1 phospholipase D active site motif domain-containing protein [Hirsutella rhossiliensis]
MADNRQGDSVSPRTRSPLSSPGNAASQPESASPTARLDHQLPPTPDTAEQQPREPRPRMEAKDYWNGGTKHPDVSPGVLSEGSAQALRSPDTSGQSRHDADGPLSPTSNPALSEAPSIVGRRSVQFARAGADPLDESNQAAQSRRGSWGAPDTPGKPRGTSFMSKIKAFASNPNLQTPKSPSAPAAPFENGSPPTANSPTTARLGSRLPDTLAEELSDADADIEETADEANIPDQGPATKKKKKRKMRRFKKGQVSSPSTPHRLPSDLTSSRLLKRRASMPDTSAQVMSDGDAREQLRRRAFRRGHSYMDSAPRGPDEDLDDADSPAPGRRAGHLRRITVFGGGGVSDGDAMSPRRPFFNSERASHFGVQKWKQVKSTLKLLRQKKEDRFDYFKSAELMAELRAGAPAVLMLASMIQRDEHGNKRIPVLLEQLRLRIKDSCPMPDDDKDRHWIFTMELEYGNGPSRMSWTVIRTIRDIYNLHFRYRFALNNDKYMPGRLDLGTRPRQPKFPYSAFPYLRRARIKGDDSSDDEQASVAGEETAGEGTAAEATAGEGATDEGQYQPRRKKSRANLWGMRRRSTGFTDPGDISNAEGAQSSAVMDMMTRRQRYVEKQRRTLEKYLSEMIRWLMFRADSNRLCRFLELSALGVRLAAEGSYHGKEGYLHIQSSKGLDFRRVLTPAKVIARHSRKWFLVRQSYIVCVESPENMNIYDVYLVDSKFSLISKRNPLKQIGSKDKQADIDLTVEAPPEKHHTLTLHTSERKVRLFSSYQSVMKQFEESINEMLRQTQWYEKKRFESFAPVRTGVFAQWLVDGRDYMWNVSRAINMARDVIYIHDWWLSPELYMRRPACISQKWRLDRLLQKKAREGVKIFVIIYRNVEAAIPIDSEYTKFSLLNLHPNIFVQRSPNQFKKNQFFFAHHEKICIVDHDVAFLGGIDLCFGRWDCPQHPIVDDKPTGFEMSERPKDAEHCQLFPGKDYSNPRVQDFFRLNEPYEEMYDRSKVPRMPWHDVSMQVVGQPARDLTRHFVQRWNYLRRGRKPTRPLPFLLPPPDAKFDELEALGLTGTCEVQILRSASTWSLGIEETEHSIQTAYIKMIEDSDHFVYMENQFFITSTEAYNTKIVNRIGDALVDRIIRAHENGEDWRCAIVIPLMPGFQNTVDEQEGTSVRLILMCQYRSICRGEQSIFGRLRAAGIEPEDYIGFYSLRQWGIMGNDVLVTEQLYIHAKTIIVDDRVALIGSANINERSMLGTRDSECAAIVRDTDMLWSTMGGKPYQVGRFAYTLRLRLMREHLGLDVDEILEEERRQEMDREAFEHEMGDIYGDDAPSGAAVGPSAVRDDLFKKQFEIPRLPSFNHDLDLEKAQATQPDDSFDVNGKEDDKDARVTGKKHQLDVSGYGPDQWKTAEKSGLDGGRDSVVVHGREVLVRSIDSQGKGALDAPKPPHRPNTGAENRHRASSAGGHEGIPPIPPFNRRTTDQLGMPRTAQLPPLPVVDDTDIGGPPVHTDPVTGRLTNGAFHPMASDIRPADITKDCMRDPVNASFMDGVWGKAARNNTKLYRRVFRCMPDSEVSTWAEYREYVEYGEKLRANMEGKAAGEESELKQEMSHNRESTAAGAGIGAPGPEAITKAVRKEAEKAPEKLSEKLSEKMPGTSQDEGKAQIAMSEGGQAELHEKSPLRNGDDEKSPRPPQGQSLFPPLENVPTKTLEPQTSRNTERKATFSGLDNPPSRDARETGGGPSGQSGSVKRRRRATTKGSRRGLSIEDMPSRADAEELLKMIQGNLVEFPYDWLLTEEQNGNWGYQVDGVAPLAI